LPASLPEHSAPTLPAAAARTTSTEYLVAWAAPAGRMAFSNYIMQSVVLGLIFYGYGLGYFGRMDVWTCLAIVVLMFAAQVAFSRWWLDRFHFGPIEWLWRTLTYGQRQPLKRATPASG
jgi:uncharacterized protein